MRLLVTRPEPDGERTAAALRARGHEVVLAPMTEVTAIPAELGPGPWAAVIITSANAAQAVENHPRKHELIGLPVFAVGARSAAAARAAGFAQVVSANGAVEDLVRLVAREIGEARQPLLYLAGADRAGDLAGELAKSGLAVVTCVIYCATVMQNLRIAVKQALASGEIGGILHFSRRSAEAYLQSAAASNLGAAALAPTHYCLSARVAAPLRAAGAANIRVAAHPDEASLLDLVESG